MSTFTAEQIELLGGRTPYVPPPVKPREVPPVETFAPSTVGPVRPALPPMTPDVCAAVWCGKVLNWFGRILIWSSQMIFRHAPRAHKFAAAHVFGPVAIGRELEREAVCLRCEHRKVKTGFEECGAEHCGCGEWRLANLRHKRKLSGYKCVEGRWGYGWLAAWYHGRHENRKLAAGGDVASADSAEAGK